MSNIETLTFDNISLGHAKIFSIKITEEILKKFAAISGDFNPLHMDEKYAKNTQFNKYANLNQCRNLRSFTL